MNKSHYDQKKWDSYTIFEQMGNIGSEVGRAFSAMMRGDEESLRGALFRGTDLFNATIESLLAKKSGRFREVMIARDQFHQAVFNNKPDPKLDDYFMQFALAARKDR